MKPRYLLPAVLVFLIGVLLGATIWERYLGVADTANLRRVEEAFRLIESRYVDDVDAEQLSESAIYGMLEGLDPHSAYIPKEEIQGVQDGFRGEFGGVGIWYEVVADTPRVSSTVTDGPSEKAGVLPGDRIITVNGSSSVGDSSRTVQRRLKGRRKTDVDITVKRRGVSEPVGITITRDRIPLYSVDTAYMLDETTGLIKISRFSSTTHREFMEKVRELEGLGMLRLIVDVRNNPGGVMEPSVQIANEFLPAGFDIVSTRSEDRNVQRTERATSGGRLEETPVIILINENSASASEILAGAIQDNDRGLLIGERTFGKALVQQQFALNDGSYMHLTVSRYYTPSGRLIQTPYDGHDLSSYLDRKYANSWVLDAERLPDSLRYETRGGRVVAGGGGIFPDHFVEADSTSLLMHPLFRGLNAQIADIRFVRNLFDREQEAWRTRWADRQDEFIDSFEVDQDLVRDFWAYVSDRGLLTGAGAPEVTPSARSTIAPLLKTMLKARIAQNLYGSSAYYPVVQSLDIDLQVAQQMWTELTDTGLVSLSTSE